MKKIFIADESLQLKENVEKLQRKSRIGDILISKEYRYIRVDVRKNKGIAWVLVED